MLMIMMIAMLIMTMMMYNCAADDDDFYCHFGVGSLDQKCVLGLKHYWGCQSNHVDENKIGAMK